MNSDKLATVNSRIDDLDKEIAELTVRRESLAVDFASGTKSAQKEVAQIDAAYDAAWKERGLLISAMSQLETLAEEEQKAVLAKVDEKRYADAAGHAAAVMMLNEQIDTRLADLNNMMTSRANALNAIRALHVVDAGYIARMLKDATTAAVAAAGLQKFVDFRIPSPNGIRPLSAANKLLAGIGKPPKKEESAA